MTTKQLMCVICGKEITPNRVGWAGGNNPEPISPIGRCCDHCDWTIVMPERIRRMRVEEKEQQR